jgi:hypothetical protein
MLVKEDLFIRGHFKVGAGTKTRLWEDTWLGDTSLAQQYPSLYKIVQCKEVIVANVLSQISLHIGFIRALTGNKWTS